MALRVQTWKGKVVRVDLGPDATVLAVKHQLQILEGVPFQQQHLFLDGQELQNADLVRPETQLSLEIQPSQSTLLGMAMPQPTEVTLGEFNASLVHLGANREEYQDRLDQWQHHDLQIYPAVLVPPGSPRARNKVIELQRGAPSLSECLHSLAAQISGLVSWKSTQESSINDEASSFAWHPFLPKWALARPDDSVWLHDLRQGKWEESALVHKAQTRIRQIQWNPLSGTVLAVACEAGVCLWHLTGRKTNSFISRPDNSPVDSISWSSCGRFLAAASKGSSQLFIWEVAKGALGTQGATVLGPPGASLQQCLWAPRSQNLLTTSRGSFRIWSRWKGVPEVGERWTSTVHQTRSAVVAAVWNATGDVLLVAQENSPLIHVVQPSTCLVGSDTVDVGAVSSGEVTVGGPVSLMAWSPTSARLAVAFAATGPGGDLIALFDTSFQQLVFSFRPVGFIRGPPHPNPDIINKAVNLEFAPNFDKGALLSVVWSGGQISTHPLYFAALKRLKRNRDTAEADEPQRGLGALK